MYIQSSLKTIYKHSLSIKLVNEKLKIDTKVRPVRIMGIHTFKGTKHVQCQCQHVSYLESLNPLTTVEFARIFDIFCIKTNPPKNAMIFGPSFDSTSENHFGVSSELTLEWTVDAYNGRFQTFGDTKCRPRVQDVCQ
jgi:hypothetical protein